MKEELEKAVADLAKKAVEAHQACDAMQFTQAALNAANALRTIEPARFADKD